MSTSKLFQPIKVGDVELKHRVVLAPLTRMRAVDDHTPQPMMEEYYSQRASEPGTLLIAEGTFIHPHAGRYPNAPGIHKDKQVAAWKKVTDAVHAKGSSIFLQAWALGRAAVPSFLQRESPGAPYISASDIVMSGRDQAPRPLSLPEIKEYAQWYATAAKNAIQAGFDGVELHGANGYLPDQFLQDTSNKRTDEYGGSVENRCRFALEMIDAMVEAVGASKVAIRISPWSDFQDMRMADPVPTFSHLIRTLKDKHPNLAYVHAVEPRVHGNTVKEEGDENESNDFLREIWAPRPFIAAGGFSPESAIARADITGDLIAFGRYFIANPDLPKRIREGIELTRYNRDTFYTQGTEGYTDYPFAPDA